MKIYFNFIKRQCAFELFIIIIASSIFIVHALFFQNWIVDDAGISFVYARNLSKGFGLVSQPGNIPVEGYSNFLWVILLTPFFFFRLFHPIMTPKILSIVLIIASFFVIKNTLSLIIKREKYIILIILSLIAVNTSFVVWSTSGLENPLYVFLLCALFHQCVKFFISEKNTKKNAVFIGLLCGLIALTRPEGILYSVIFPVLMLTIPIRKSTSTFKSSITNFIVYSIVNLSLVVSFIL